MKIYHKKDVLNVSKPEGINVVYYLLNEYGVHYNEQVPNSIQTWHHHAKSWETLYVIAGELLAKWRENGVEKSEILMSGDLVETERTPHTFINNSNKVAKFLVIKQILSGKDKREILKTDKIID